MTDNGSVILTAAVTGILAAVVTMLVLGMGDHVETHPRASFSFDFLAIPELPASDLIQYIPGGASLTPPVEVDDNEASVSWDHVSHFTDHTASNNWLINHYFALLEPDCNLVVHDEDAVTVDESRSTGYLDYEGEEWVTDLPITMRNAHIDHYGGGQ